MNIASTLRVLERLKRTYIVDTAIYRHQCIIRNMFLLTQNELEQICKGDQELFKKVS